MKFSGMVICPRAYQSNGKIMESEAPTINLSIMGLSPNSVRRLTLHHHTIVMAKTRQEIGLWLDTPHSPPDGPTEYLVEAYAQLAATIRKLA